MELHNKFYLAWIPYQKYILHSKLTPAQIVREFEEAVENSDLFSGTISRDGFKLTGEDGKNGFRPEAKIQFVEVIEGTICTITIMHQRPVFAFLLGAAIFVLIGACYTIIADIIKGNFRIEVLSFFGFLLVIYLISTLGFNVDLPDLKDFINKILEVETRG